MVDKCYKTLNAFILVSQRTYPIIWNSMIILLVFITVLLKKTDSTQMAQNGWANGW